MPLIDLDIGASTNLVVLEANSAAEMQQLIRTWLADNPTLFVWDAQLEGGGAAPRFAFTLTVGGSEGAFGSTLIYQANVLQAYAQGGMNPIPPTRLSRDLVSAISGDTTLAKALLATGGVGPHWMEVALTSP